MKHVKHFDDLHFTVIASPQIHHVDFEVYHIECWVKDDSGKIDPWYHRAGSDIYPDSVNTVDQSEVFLSGYVKWDGCSNWKFDEQERLMLHECDREGLERYGKILAACWDWASELLENWNG